MASAAGVPQPSSNTNKASSGSAAPAMTFYKAVEQKQANAELTPSAETKTDTNATSQSSAPANSGSPPALQSNGVDPNTTMPLSGYFVQVAAVSKQEDADALVDALKKKEYPAFVATPASDKLFRVQLGPFSDIKDAEGMRTKLVGDGYSPILKK